MVDQNATFIPKLFSMVEDPKIPEIYWAQSGSFFVIPDPEEFARTVLPVHFKHNNFASFVRQLNMYNFRKVVDMSSTKQHLGTQRAWAFEHPGFLKGRAELLPTIHRRPKTSQKKLAALATVKSEPAAPSEDQRKKAHLLIEELMKTKQQQQQISRQFSQIQAEKELLWQEYSLAQKKLFEQQQVTKQVLEFLAAVLQQNPNLLPAKQRQLLGTLSEPQSSNALASVFQQDEPALPPLSASPVLSHPTIKEEEMDLDFATVPQAEAYRPYVFEDAPSYQESSSFESLFCSSEEQFKFVNSELIDWVPS